MSENKVIIKQMNSSSSGYNNVYPKGWGENILRVTSISGATVTVSYNGVVVSSYTYKENETIHDFYLISGYGTYTITATKTNHIEAVETFENTFAGLHEITVKPVYFALTVTSIEGATVTVAKDTTTTYTYKTGETTHDFLLKDGTGNYTVTASKEGNYITQSQLVNIATIGVYSATVKPIFMSPTLESNSWDTIKKVSDAGVGSTVWSIGDKKSVVINGTLFCMGFSCILFLHGFFK